MAGSGPLLLVVADTLRKQGASVVSVSEQAPAKRVLGFARNLLAHPAKLCQGIGLQARLLGTRCRYGVWTARAEGKSHVERVTLTNGRTSWTEPCDLLACGFGLVPNVELPLLLGCELMDGAVRVNEFQAASAPAVFCAGEPTGIGGADCALVEGRIAGYAAAECKAQAKALFARRASWHRFRRALARTYALRPELRSLAANETLVCRCEDVALGKLRSFAGWREAKLHSRCGMGPCQGRVCGPAAQFILGWTLDSVRPPLVPARVQQPHFEQLGTHPNAIMNRDQELWTAIDQYVGARLIASDPILETALDASAAAGLPPIQVSPCQGKLLQLLAQIHQARTILEIGTLGGYSTIWLGRALPADGRLVTLELEPRHAEVARSNLARAGLSSRVEQRVGPAIQTLPRLAAEGQGPFDFIFIDADKPGTADYFRWAVKLSRPGSVILVDNVIRKGALIEEASTDPAVQGMRRFLDVLGAEPRVTSTVIQTAGSKGYDGFALSIVR